MGLFSFGKKKEKTLEERAKEFGIILGKPSENDYERYPIKGAGESVETAENNLIKNVRDSGAKYLFNVSLPEVKKLFNSRNYVISAVAYKPIKPKVA